MASSDSQDVCGEQTTGPFSTWTENRTTVLIGRQISHRSELFTQGLIVINGSFLEGSGLRDCGSKVVAYSTTDGMVNYVANIDCTKFGEGIALLGNRLYQLTWTSEVCYVWDAAAFMATGVLQSIGTFSYSGQGWGLCDYHGSLIMSNGSATLVERDPATFEVTRQFTVRMPDGSSVARLNELECTDDAIYANVWYSDTIVRIDPVTGVVDQLIDAGAVLRNAAGMPLPLRCGDVLNGIAIDPDSGDMWLTGKNWPRSFSVQLVSSNGTTPSPTPAPTLSPTQVPSPSPSTTDPTPMPVPPPTTWEPTSSVHTAAPTTQPRILCLHGGGGTGPGFASEINHLVQDKPGFDFVFVSASDGLWLRDPPSKSEPTSDPNWDADSIALLDDIVASQGPFYGILGYSQGAAYVPAYIAHVPSGTFQIAMMFCGYLPSTHLGILGRINAAAPIATPALIFMGANDFVITNGMTREQVPKFVTAMVVASSSAGHHLPFRSDATYPDVLSFLGTPPPASSTPTPAPTTPEPTPAPTNYCPAGYDDFGVRWNWGIGRITIVQTHEECCDRCTQYSGPEYNGGCKGYMTGMYYGMLYCMSYGGNAMASNCASFAHPSSAGIGSGELGSINARTNVRNIGGTCCQNRSFFQFN